MTYHDDTRAARRRPWLIAAPLVIVHRARRRRGPRVWFYAAGEAETRMDAWRAQQAQRRARVRLRQPVGRRLSVPHRGALHGRCGVELKDAQPPIAIKLKEILAVAQVWDPKLLIAEFTGPLAVSDPAGSAVRDSPPGASRRRACAARRRRRSAPRSWSTGCSSTARRATLFDSKRAEFHARVQYGSWPHNPAIDLAVKLAARGRADGARARRAAARRRHPGGAARHEGPRAEADARCGCANGRRRAAARDPERARSRRRESLANATGTLALTPRGGSTVRCGSTVAGIERFLPTIGGEQGASLNLDRVAPALNAIERAVPGLAQRVPPQRQQSLQAGLLGAARAAGGNRGQARRRGAGPLHRRRGVAWADPARASAAGVLRQAMHDAVIIGGGHNGLTCAAYLAMAGLKVVVLERRRRRRRRRRHGRISSGLPQFGRRLHGLAAQSEGHRRPAARRAWAAHRRAQNCELPAAR